MPEARHHSFEIRAARPGPAPAALRDPIANLAAVDGFLASLIWWQSGVEAWLLQTCVNPTGWGIDWLWFVVWKLVETVHSIGTQTANALSAYWTLVLQPIWSRLWSVVVEHWNLANNAWRIALGALDYGGRWVIRQLTDGVWWLAAPIRGLVEVLQSARLRVGQAGSVLDAAAYTLGARAWQGFVSVREHSNLIAAWVSHALHPLGPFREDPWVWSAICYHGDLQAVLFGSLVGADLDARVAALAQKFPFVTLAQQLVKLADGSAAQTPEMIAALEDFAGI